MEKIIKAYSIFSQNIYELVLDKLNKNNYKPFEHIPSYQEIKEADLLSRKYENEPLRPVLVLDEINNNYTFWSKKELNLLENTKIEYLNDTLEFVIKNEYSGLKARSYYNSKGTRENCHNLKELYTEQTYNPEEPQNTDYIKAKAEIADYFIRQNIFNENSILIPAPQHTGKAEYTKDLCNEICFHTHSKILDCLQCKPHKTLYEQKKNNEKINVEMSLFDLDENLEQKNIKDFSELTEKYYLQGKNIYFIDNVMSTGYTFNHAAELIPGIIPAPYAIGNFVNIQYKDGKYMAENEIENLEKENKEISVTIEDIPEYAVYYMTYGEMDNNINEDEKKMIDDFMDKNNLDHIVDLSEMRSFVNKPAFGLSTTCYNWAEFKLRQNINENNISDEMDKYIEMMNVNHGMSEHDMLIDMELSNNNEDDFDDEDNTVYDFLTWHEIKDKKGYLEESDGKHNIEYNLSRQQYKLSDKEGWKDFEELPFSFTIDKFKDFAMEYITNETHKTNPNLDYYFEDFTNTSKYQYKDLLKGLSADEILQIKKDAEGAWKKDISMTFSIMDFKEADEKLYYPEDRNKVMLRIYSELEDCNYHTLNNLLLERNYEEADRYIDYRGYSNLTNHISANHTKYDNLLFGVNGKDFSNLDLLNEYKGDNCKIYTDAIYINNRKSDLSEYLTNCIENMLKPDNFESLYKNDIKYRLAFDTAKKVRSQIADNIDNPFTDEQVKYLEKNSNLNLIYNKNREKYDELYKAALKKYPESFTPLEDTVKYLKNKRNENKIKDFDNAKKQYEQNIKKIDELKAQLDTMKKQNKVFISSVKDILSKNRLTNASEINSKIMNSLNENQKLLIIERIEQKSKKIATDNNKSNSTAKKR